MEYRYINNDKNNYNNINYNYRTGIYLAIKKTNILTSWSGACDQNFFYILKSPERDRVGQCNFLVNVLVFCSN